jgi:hypothetical protein
VILRIQIVKEILFASFALIVFTLSSGAQISHDFNSSDVEPVITTTIAKDMVPPAIVQAVDRQFSENNPVSWSRFPYALKEYGWVYDIGADNIDLDRFEVAMKTDKGNDLWAVYTKEGELVETREVSSNIPIPASVMGKFLKSQYKNWQVVGNKEIIRFYHDHIINKSHVEQHFRITVEKNGVKRSISFNWEGDN